MARRTLILANPGMEELAIEVDDSDPPDQIKAAINRHWRAYHVRNILPGTSDETAGPAFVFPLPRRWRDQLPRSPLAWMTLALALVFGVLCVLLIGQGGEGPRA